MRGQARTAAAGFGAAALESRRILTRRHARKTSMTLSTYAKGSRVPGKPTAAAAAYPTISKIA